MPETFWGLISPFRRFIHSRRTISLTNFLWKSSTYNFIDIFFFSVHTIIQSLALMSYNSSQTTEHFPAAPLQYGASTMKLSWGQKDTVTSTLPWSLQRMPRCSRSFLPSFLLSFIYERQSSGMCNTTKAVTPFKSTISRCISQHKMLKHKCCFRMN